jgi:hypothetical protein
MHTTAGRLNWRLNTFALSGCVGFACALVAVLSVPRIGIIACCYSTFALGVAIGMFWIEHDLPPSGFEKRLAVEGGLVTLAVFCTTTAGLPIQSFRQMLFGTGIGSGSKLAILAASLVTVASLARLGVSVRLLNPYCAACSSWCRSLTSYGYFGGSEEQLKERLLAHDFRYLANVHATGQMAYRFMLMSCRCSAVQFLNVDHDFDPGEATPMRKIVRRLNLTKTEAESVRAYLPDSKRFRYELTGWIGLLGLVITATEAVYLGLRAAGF